MWSGTCLGRKCNWILEKRRMFTSGLVTFVQNGCLFGPCQIVSFGNSWYWWQLVLRWVGWEWISFANHKHLQCMFQIANPKTNQSPKTDIELYSAPGRHLKTSRSLPIKIPCPNWIISFHNPEKERPKLNFMNFTWHAIYRARVTSKACTGCACWYHLRPQLVSLEFVLQPPAIPFHLQWPHRIQCLRKLPCP